MIIAIIIVRALAINRLPKKGFIILWGVVLLRLLIPFSVPSVLSAYSMVERNIPVQDAITAVPDNYLTPQAAAVQPGIAGMGAVSTGVMLTETSQFPVWTVIWIAGMILCALFFIVSYIRCHLEFRTSVPVHNVFADYWLHEHRLRRSVEIRQSDIISAPLTYGILRPVILMPKKTDWDNRQQLQYVLLHEYIHICRFDMVWKLVTIIALCIHWFNPMVWVMYILFNRDIELSCDESVVRRFGETSKSSYARTLITMEEKKSGLMPLCNNFSKNAIEERIKAIMKIKKATVWTVAVSAAVIAVIVILFATSARAEQPQNNDGENLIESDRVTMSNESKHEFNQDLTIDVDALNTDNLESEYVITTDGESNDISAEPVRESTMLIPYELEGSIGEMPSTLYIGEGFSIYIPDEGWEIIDRDLTGPYLMRAVYAPEQYIEVAYYSGETADDVTEHLLSEGYVYDDYSSKMRKFDDVADDLLLLEARVYTYEDDVWVVYSSFNSAVEWGSRIDAIADTFAVSVNFSHNFLPVESYNWADQVSGAAGELEEIMTAFSNAYFSGDRAAVEQYLTASYEWPIDVYEDPDHVDDVAIHGIKGLESIDVSDTLDSCTLWLEFTYPGDDSYTYLTVEFVKENGSWKVGYYGLEK